MSEAFDPFHIWLGIPLEEQPPNHYRLLGIKLFESNPDVVSGAADRQMSHVRSFQTGNHGVESQRLLNELSGARFCLLTADKKAEYDQSLRAKLAARASTPAPKSLPVAKPIVKVRAPAPVAVAADLPPLDPVAGGNPLAGIVRQSDRKKKPRNGLPTLLIAGGVALLAVVGLVWIIASGGRDELRAQATPKPTNESTAGRPSEIIREPTGSVRHDKLEQQTVESAKAPATSDPAGDAPSVEGDQRIEPARAPFDAEPGDADEMEAVSGPREPESDVESEVAHTNPVPDSASLKSAQAELQKLFKDDLAAARKPADKTALAEKLLAMRSKTDVPADRFALLNEAGHLAIAAGNVKLALQAATMLAADFDVDRLERVTGALEELSGKELSTSARKEIVEAGTPLADEAVAASQFKLARRLLAVAAAAARKSKQPDVAKELTRRGKELSAQERAAAAAAAARTRLAESPDDAEAHLALGRYLCLVVGNWDEGLPHWKQCSNAALRSAAERDLEAAGQSSADGLELGDMWWDLAEKEKGNSKEQYQARAGHWYTRSIDELAGLSKSRVEKRLAEIADRGAASLTTISAASPVAKSRKSVTYLKDLKPGELQLRSGNSLDTEVSVNGFFSEHGLFMHPTSNNSAHVAYQLGRNFRGFQGAAGIHDHVAGQTVTPLTFRIVGDGKLLWRSAPLQKRSAVQEFDVRVADVEKLELFVDCPGDDGNAAAVWFEPRLTGAGIPARK